MNENDLTRIGHGLRKVGHITLIWLQEIGLGVIAISTLIAMGDEIGVMISKGMVQLADLLLMFIYLEVLAMVSMYLDSGKLPVRMPLYIAMVALARYLIIDMKSLDSWQMLAVSVAALILALTVVVISYVQSKYPDEQSDEFH